MTVYRGHAHPSAMAHRMTESERQTLTPNRFGNTPHVCDNPDCGAWCDADHIPLTGWIEQDRWDGWTDAEMTALYGGKRLA